MATLSTFIKVAPEIPLLAYLDDHYPAGDSATSAIIDLQTAVEEVLIFEGNGGAEKRGRGRKGREFYEMTNATLQARMMMKSRELLRRRDSMSLF